MKDVILKPGIFPPSQTSYILQEKSILLFCSLWEYNPNGLLGSFLFPQTHQLQCLEKHGEIFRSCQHIFFCWMRTYRCQMLRASEAASSMFPHKEHSHFLLHPKETDGKHLAHLNTKGSVFDIPPGNWSSIEDLNKILVFSTTFRHKMDGELAELCQCVFFLEAVECTQCCCPPCMEEHTTALQTVLVEGIWDYQGFWLEARVSLQNFRLSPGVDGYVQFREIIVSWHWTWSLLCRHHPWKSWLLHTQSREAVCFITSQFFFFFSNIKFTLTVYNF